MGHEPALPRLREATASSACKCWAQAPGPCRAVVALGLAALAAPSCLGLGACAWPWLAVACLADLARRCCSVVWCGPIGPRGLVVRPQWLRSAQPGCALLEVKKSTHGFREPLEDSLSFKVCRFNSRVWTNFLSFGPWRTVRPGQKINVGVAAAIKNRYGPGELIFRGGTSPEEGGRRCVRPSGSACLHHVKHCLGNALRPRNAL